MSANWLVRSAKRHSADYQFVIAMTTS